MSEKVRGALFDIIGSVDDLKVLDAYAGSGALGFEALSRGAKKVTAIELATPAVKAIRSSIAELGLELDYRLMPMKVESWLSKNDGKKFDLIFYMPPYSLQNQKIFEDIGSLLDDNGTMVVEYSHQALPFDSAGLQRADTRDYGDQKLAFYQKAKLKLQ